MGTIEKIFTKILGIGAGIVPVFAYLELNIEAFSILALLIIIDFISGIVKDVATGNEITSKNAWIGLISKCFILLIILSLALLNKGLSQYNILLFIDSMLALFMIVETYSIIANIVSANEKKEMSEQVSILLVLQIPLKFIKSMLNQFLNNNDKNLKNK